MRGLRWVLLISVLFNLNGPARGGSVEVTNDASAVGNYGLAVTLEPDPMRVAYVEKTLPAGNSFRLRFRWRVGTMVAWGEGDPGTTGDDPRLAIAFVKQDPVSNASANRRGNIWLSVRQGQWALWGYCQNNDLAGISTSTLTLPSSVTDTNQHLQIDFEIRAASGAGMSDGSCCLRVEGIGEVCRNALANDLVSYGALSMGATLPVLMTPDLSGTFHIDEVIVSN